MGINERLELILQEVNTYGSVKVTDLSEQFNISEVTIRNDIRRLDEQGLLKKIYGGAVKTEERLAAEFFPGEYYLNADKKLRIAAKAYEYINNRDSIIIDDSTTGSYLAGYIRENTDKRLIVVTNSILSIALLCDCNHVELFVAGGHVIGHPPASLDSITISALDKYRVDKAFVGVNGINLNLGLTSIGTPQMDVKRKIIDLAGQTFVLADSSKFGNGNMFTVCPIEKVHKIITDRDISHSTLKVAASKGVVVETV